MAVFVTHLVPVIGLDGDTILYNTCNLRPLTWSVPAVASVSGVISGISGVSAGTGPVVSNVYLPVTPIVAEEA